MDIANRTAHIARTAHMATAIRIIPTAHPFHSDSVTRTRTATTRTVTPVITRTTTPTATTVITGPVMAPTPTDQS